ncbi:MAG: ornithine--oxo-acid transaminase [Candidatus Lokiarchaeota archaeon]|nr:ornithine--oxo-acid transaminase [Candidatus Lokiarchaeota archaeon]
MRNSKDYIKMDHEYGAHNYHPIPVVISRAKGVWVFDPEGKKYLDCLSAYSSQNTGHLHPEIIQAMKDQLDKVTLTSRAFHNDVMGPFLKQVCELVEPHLTLNGSKVMALPMNTGAEAVETGLKVARAWGYIKKQIPKEKAHIIACSDNFHGRTITICGISSDPITRHDENFGPFTPGFSIIPYGDVSALEKEIQKIGPQYVVAFLLEPIQGEAGVKIPPIGYLKNVRSICSKYNMLMIVDEIQTGLCRTGELFAVDHENVKPDMFLLGKALGGGVYPVSAVVTTREIIGPDVIPPGTHGSTFGGNPLGAAVGMKALEVMIGGNLAKRAKELGKYFIDGLKAIAENKTRIPVKEIRGKGLLIAIEFEGNIRFLVEDLMHNGILAKDTHSTIIRFAPPLVITKDEIDWALKIIKKVLVAQDT